MTLRALFLVNGLGLGNSSRCHAVIQQLVARGVAVEVVTSANGYWYFSDRPEVQRLTEIPALQYGKKDGQINISATLGSARVLLSATRDADRIIDDAIHRFKPHVVVSDSVYSARSAGRAGVPLVALNNADMVIRGVRAFRDWPGSILPQFCFVELADALYHRCVPDLVISPRLDPGDSFENDKIRRVGPIVRSECEVEGDDVDTLREPRVVVMLSGSAFGSQVRFPEPLPGMKVDVIGRDQPPDQPVMSGITFHGRVRETLKFLKAASLVVVNGGFSAVSEALYLQKPMIVVPVQRHAEQWVNARTIKHLGVGTDADERSIEAAIMTAMERLQTYRDAYRHLPPIENGAIRAADEIINTAKKISA